MLHCRRTLQPRQRGDIAMKTEQSANGPWGLAEIMLSTLAGSVAVAVLLFPSYSGLYGATKRAEQGAPAPFSVGLQRSRLEQAYQAYQVPPRSSVSPRPVMSPMTASQKG